MNKFFPFLIVTLFILSSVTCRLSIVSAQEMESQNFKIQGGNFNMTSGNKASTNFRLSDIVGQTAATIFASKGYIIQSGFLNSAGAGIFYFSVTPQTVDFGNLTPDSPQVRLVTIKIANGDVPGYIVKAAENQPMTTTAEATIPDTICDEAKNTCTPKKASLWQKTTAYGFGYRMDGKTVPKDFSKDGYLRSFAATRRNEEPEAVMQTQARKVTDLATMTLKVNVSRSQPVGQYRNVISFTAIAGI